MDWLEEFQKKFIEDKELTNLKEEKFYGNITINFYKGKISVREISRWDSNIRGFFK